MTTLELLNQPKEEDKTMGSWFHNLLQGRLNNLFYKYYDECYIAIPELSIEINQKEFKPDLSIYPQLENNYLIGDAEDVIKTKQLPLCAIEILSPTQSYSELKPKIKLYLENGIKSVWLVIPDFQTIYVFHDTFYHHKIYDIDSVLIDEYLNIQLNVLEIFKIIVKNKGESL